MTKIDVVAQATYPVSLPNGRHLYPGEIARKIDRTPEIETSLQVGFLRDVTPQPTSTKEETQRKPRAEIARDENQEEA